MHSAAAGPSTARAIIDRLGLEPHPEGGWFAQTWRHRPPGGGRGAGSAIYYLLEGGGWSRWHRIDADEIWHFHAGDPLELRMVPERQRMRTAVLGTHLEAGQAPQVVVPAGAWQSARCLGDYTLAGATVSPAFTDEHFELAPEGWEPPGLGRT